MSGITPDIEALQLSPEDEILRASCCIRARTNHKRAGVQMYEAVLIYTVTGKRRKRRPSRVYKLIMQRKLGIRRLPRGMMVDHIDGNPLNNKRDNLRLATPMQNSANSVPRAGGTSRYKGVYLDRKHNTWRSQISLTLAPGKYARLVLGRFSSEEEAAYAYNEIAAEWYGEFARLNVIL